jgi:hypothetical protein
MAVVSSTEFWKGVGEMYNGEGDTVVVAAGRCCEKWDALVGVKWEAGS